jgi:hypothetical protein
MGLDAQGMLDVTRFAPAHNTMTAARLSLLNTRENWVSLLGTAGWTPSNPDAYLDAYLRNPRDYQVMLGFMRSLDASDQWLPKRPRASAQLLPEPDPASEMFLARDCGLYSTFFMQQPSDKANPERGSWAGSVCGRVASLLDRTPANRCGGIEVSFTLAEPATTIGAVVRLTNLGAPSVYLLSGTSNSGLISTNVSVAPGAAPVPVTVSAAHTADLPLTTTAKGPATCWSLSASCGSYSDGCGGQVSCGSCSGVGVCSPTERACVYRAPVVTSFGATPSWNVATISWTTDIPADGQVEYGTTTSYGYRSPLNTKLVIAHFQELIGLQPSTDYYFRVISKNVFGAAPAGTGSFRTPAIPPPIPPPFNCMVCCDGSLACEGALCPDVVCPVTL